MHARKGVAEGAAVGAAAVAVAVTYGIYAVHPWQGSTPLRAWRDTAVQNVKAPRSGRAAG